MKKIFKILWSTIFLIMFVIGFVMFLSAYGWGISQNAFQMEDNLGTQKFICYTLMIFGLLFGVIPYFGFFWTIFKIALSIVGVLVFVFGLCLTIQYYANVEISFVPNIVAGSWLGPLTLVLGLLIGVIPFVRNIKKLFSSK